MQDTHDQMHYHAAWVGGNNVAILFSVLMTSLHVAALYPLKNGLTDFSHTWNDYAGEIHCVVCSPFGGSFGLKKYQPGP